MLFQAVQYDKKQHGGALGCTIYVTLSANSKPFTDLELAC